MADFTIKQGDTVNALMVTLTTTQADLADAVTVEFVMSDTAFNNKIGRAVDAFTSPVATVKFTEEELADHGHFLGEFIVTYDDGLAELFPNDGYLTIEILRNAGTIEIEV